MNTRKLYFKELKLEDWIKQERRKLWCFIWDILDIVGEEKIDFWSRRLLNNFTQRLSCLRVGTNWIEMIASYSASQAVGSYIDEKTQRYCILLRDCARDEMRRKQEEMELSYYVYDD